MRFSFGFGPCGLWVLTKTFPCSLKFSLFINGDTFLPWSCVAELLRDRVRGDICEIGHVDWN